MTARIFIQVDIKRGYTTFMMMLLKRQTLSKIRTLIESNFIDRLIFLRLNKNRLGKF